MDVNPWGVLSLGLSGVRDYKQSLAFIDNANGAGTLTDPKYVQTLDYDGQGHMMTAYDFDWQYDCAPAQTQTGQPNGNRCADIWLEGSAFMSLAHFMNGNTSKADSILNEMIKKQGTSGTLLGGMPYSLKGSNNNYWQMKQENCVSSTGWLIIAIARYNPFTAEYLTGTSLSIGSINPTSGPVGSAVTISGSGFGATQGASTLKFGTAAAAITSWSNTSITAVVPSGLAAGSYQVVANVNGAASNSQAFTVTSASITPSVSSLSPVSGAAGSSVTITGTNFGSTQGASTVKFGAIAAAVTSWSSTSIQATVPSGLAAGSYNVVVTVNGTASNSQAFSVTSSGGVAVSKLYVNTGGVLSAAAGTGATTNTIASAGGTNHDGTPTNATTYLIAGLNGTYDASKATGFNLFVDAGANVGDGLQVQVQYDFTGDGTWDRTETYNYFATNPVVDWENYTQGQGLKSSAGSFANLVNGKVRINVWNAIGSTATTLRTNASSANGQQSIVTIPFN
ncbi:IPT/TIG domain-containing protein [Paenibacillus alba]|uniref:IPT/TIG domain-containing protein n=1 Tax=Paenibacillus alba TaxID=1197127 RepID=UPI00156421D1|nr:IPT/TIG domain-containing protein [Paenibacillus alba]